MDPNVTLTAIRLLIERVGSRAADADAVRLATRVSELDDWLSKGGALPDAWARLMPYQHDHGPCD